MKRSRKQAAESPLLLPVETLREDLVRMSLGPSGAAKRADLGRVARLPEDARLQPQMMESEGPQQRPLPAEGLVVLRAADQGNFGQDITWPVYADCISGDLAAELMRSPQCTVLRFEVSPTSVLQC